MLLNITCYDKANYRDTNQHIKHVMDFLKPYILDRQVSEHYWFRNMLTVIIFIDDYILNRNTLLNISIPDYFTYPIFDGSKTVQCNASIALSKNGFILCD